MVYFLKYLLKLLKVVAAWLENNACIQVYNSVWSILEFLFYKKLTDNENLLTQFLLSELTVCLNPLTSRPGCMPGSRYTGVGVLFLARLLILIEKGGLLQLKFGVVGVGVGVNIHLWAR